MYSAVVSSLLVASAMASHPEEHPGKKLLEVSLQNQEQLDTVLDMLHTKMFDRDQDFEMMSREKVQVWATKEQHAVLLSSGLSAVAAGVDMSSYEMSNYTYTAGSQDWAQYCNFDCMTARLQDISATCGWPLKSVGKSVQGRDIWVITVGPNPDAPKVLIASSIHGDEAVGTQISQRFVWESCFEPTAEQTRISTTTTTAWMMMMNPDGNELIRRSNANGRDLNRDFPMPGTTPNFNRQIETVNYMNYVAATPSLRVSSMYHGGAIVANYPYDSCSYRITPTPCVNNRPPALTPEDAWAQEMARAYTWPPTVNCLYDGCIVNGASWYQIEGGLQDYNYYFHNIMDVTLEISVTKRPSAVQLPAFYNENYNAMLNYISVAQKF